MKRYSKYILTAASLLMMASSCNFLDEDPQGTLTKEQAEAQVDGLVTSAYASLGNDHYDVPFSLWPYGNVRSDDAYKGGNDINDILDFHYYEISQNIKTDFAEPNNLWFYCYEAISRTNQALAALKKVSSSDYPSRDTRMGEMYFLRGHFYFLLKQVFGHIPFVDEDLPLDDYDYVANTLSNDEQWAWICSDFNKAYELLPPTQTEIGRANKHAAAAYCAKAYLYKAYRQDEKNNVVYPADASDLAKAIEYADYVLDSSVYGLESDMAFNFLPGAYQNGKESIFAIQYSIDDGTMFGRLNWGDLLSVPMGLGCCDFHKPSQNLVNAYKTDANGLPLFDTYDNSDYDKSSNTADPRLFHTVALPDLPYKYNSELIYSDKWNRNQNVYGVYASLKENVDPSCDCFVNVSPFYANSKNRIVIRYADVVLIKAEALIETQLQANIDKALTLINSIRDRASKSTKFISYAPNLKVESYTNANWNYDYAQKALRWERRLEFAMEGSRFFDLVRWGIADKTINNYYSTESTRRSYYSGASFTKNKNEYIPIPQQQISFSNGIYKQNYGW